MRTTIRREVIARRQCGQPQLRPAFGTGAHQHRAVVRTSGQPAERPCASDIWDVVFGEAVGTDADAPRLARRPLDREALATEPLRQCVITSVIRPLGKGQRANIIVRHAGAARERCDEERIGFAPPLRMRCEVRLTVAEQQGLRRDAERIGESQQPRRQCFIRQWRHARRQSPRLDRLRVEELDLVYLSRRHVGAPWEG